MIHRRRFSATLFLLAACPLAARAADGFFPIFNGKTLDGWDGDPTHWRVEDGCLTGETTKENPLKGNTFLVWRAGEVDDFELRCQFRIVGGNSGIQFRSFENEKEWGKWVIGGYQADMSADNQWTGAVYGERYRGILAEPGEKTVIGKDHQRHVAGAVSTKEKVKAAIKNEEWNEYRIRAQGNRMDLEINGLATASVTDDDAAEARRSGLLALQLHAGPPMKVQYRNIEIQRLPLGDRKKIVFLAGDKSHGWGAHEHNAGCILLAKALNQSGLPVLATVYQNGWPKERSALENADAVVVYCDGGDGHMALGHLDQLEPLMKKGVGLACLHYGVEPAAEGGKNRGRKELLDWIGGYFETHWSVNPHWTADFAKLPEHPIARGVKPFHINDEWYFHMRFRPEMQGVTPILSAVAPPETMNRGDDAHAGNPAVRESVKKGESQVVAWAAEREGGGRGFGFTGGHVHDNWGHEDFRKLVLNAIVWIAHGDVPESGVPSKPLSRADLDANQDEAKPGK